MLIKRIITALILGSAVTVALLLAPTRIAAAVLGLLFVAGAWEWAGLARLSPAARAAYTGLFAAILLAAPWWVFDRGVIAVLLLIGVLWWLLALLAVLTYPRRLPLAPVAVAGFAALLPAWAALTHLHGAMQLGPQLAMTVLALVWAADTGAYFTGRSIGRTKLAPAVSPGKTWEGVAGGVATAAVVSAVAAALLELPLVTVVAVGAVTALVSVLGDLTVSIGKRNVGLKDSGRLLPGHGGMLDRIDSLTAAAPIFVLGLLAAGVIS
ncbi:MAG: phosphatidate cytidylyltransferase [Gammaproteobacteria bacterium]|nr:phosphatidate cytidylyltransferase [Gammaproteobacteria bacterium]